VNFHVPAQRRRDRRELVVRHGVRAVSYSRSPGKQMIARLKDAG
jgi:nitronate monooxygenase